MNCEGLIAIAIAVACHRIFETPIWVAWLIFGLWFGGILIITLVLTFLVKDAPSNDSGTGSRNTSKMHFSSRGDGQHFKEEQASDIEQDTD